MVVSGPSKAEPPRISYIQRAQQIHDDPQSTRQSYMLALDHMSKALELEPDRLLCYTLYSDLYLKTGRIRDAILILEKALEEDVHGAEAVWIRIAYLYDIAGSPDASIASYEQAIFNNPEDDNLQKGYVNALIRAKRYDEARFRLSLRNDPNTMAILLYKMAETDIVDPEDYHWMSLVTEAESLLADAPESVVLHAAMMTSNLALVYAGDDESVPVSLYRKAVALLEPITDTTLNPETVWSLLFELYSTLGEIEKADEARRMLALDPPN